ncbi:hypothetical protein CBM2634_A10132 [Cupriavidus taiwanensis]|uniref:Uncharacterized protein n=1 Tax=Cupriavidus taiwanensis TaxID=164546 RepID=A0A375IUV3_9BURK|nr:hypothetical protein CBM2634_A10132 [Cupriavidus taiwanensis]
MLGVFEVGLFPGMVFYLTLWLPVKVWAPIVQQRQLTSKHVAMCDCVDHCHVGALCNHRGIRCRCCRML